MATLWALYQELNSCISQKDKVEDDNIILKSAKSDIDSLNGEISSIASNMRSGPKSLIKSGFGGQKGNELQMQLNMVVVNLSIAQAKIINLSSEVDDKISNNDRKINDLNNRIDDIKWQISQYEE